MPSRTRGSFDKALCSNVHDWSTWTQTTGVLGHLLEFWEALLICVLVMPMDAAFFCLHLILTTWPIQMATLIHPATATDVTYAGPFLPRLALRVYARFKAESAIGQLPTNDLVIEAQQQE